MNKTRIAIVGAGPAGIYAADLLLKNDAGIDFSIDIFDELPAPYGLVRYGVSPDHPRIKGIIGALREILDRGEVRFFGNVRYGRDLNLDELKTHYHGVIFATGASRDQNLNIPGIHAEGSFGAADFVSWFDAHPDAPDEWPLTAERVAVIGNGNVALDVSRMLVKDIADLLKTEIPANVAEGFAKNPLTELHLFGRRGPGTVRFTPLELRELGEVAGVQIVLNPEDFEVEDAFAESEKERNKQLIIVGRVFDSWLTKNSDNNVSDQPKRKLFMHFWSRPHEVLTNDGKVSGLRIERTIPDGTGNVQGTGEMRDFKVESIYRAVGYLGSELDEVPFDATRGVIRNEEGRAIDVAGNRVPGIYTTGWIKRGPVGLIGHTKSDAMQTTQALIDDVNNLWLPTHPGEEAVTKLLQDKGIASTDLSGWVRLDNHEIELGKLSGRERIKVKPRSEMTRISRGE